MKYILLLSLITPTLTAHAADSFEHRYYKTIQSIIWAADKAKVPRELVLTICWGESSFRTTQVTHKDGTTKSYGVCQVKLETALFMDRKYHHRIKATPARLEIVSINAFYAARYLHWQLSQYNNDWKLAVDAYNRGTAYGSKTRYVRKFIKNHEYIKKNVPLHKAV